MRPLSESPDHPAPGGPRMTVARGPGPAPTRLGGARRRAAPAARPPAPAVMIRCENLNQSTPLLGQETRGVWHGERWRGAGEGRSGRSEENEDSTNRDILLLLSPSAL